MGYTPFLGRAIPDTIGPVEYPVRSHPEASAAATLRREAIERRIFASAVELIESGVPWSQLGIRELAERANLSRTAFYDFFGSKNEVLEQLILGLHRDLVRTLAEPAFSAELDAGLVRDVRPSLDLLAGLNERYGPVYQAFLEAGAEDPQLRALWHQLLGEYREIAADSLQRIWNYRPAASRSEALAAAEILILMTERTMLVLLSAPEPVPPQRQAEMLDALAAVWHQTVAPAAIGATLPG